MHTKDSFELHDVFRKEYFYSLVGSLLLLGVSYIAEHLANLYEQEYSLRPTSVYVGDLLLDNLPVIDLNIIIIDGALISIVLGILFVVLSRPRYIIFSIKALALAILIRALFISLTHVGIYPGNIDPGVGFFDGIYTYLNFQTGFFFSGHTALPFLMGLVFWHEQRWRIIFLLMSVVFGVAVLLAHIHYSIDVL